MFLTTIAGIAALAARVQGSLDLTFGNDDDLTSFVTRPEIKAPRINLTTYDATRITPGYWFVAPYAMIAQERQPHKYYQPCQTGPAIYDSNGELVWSGACQVRNQNTCDFRAWQFNNTLYTSAILTPFNDVNDTHGHGIIMDTAYNTHGNIYIPDEMNNFNMHELNLADEGKTALHFIHEPIEADVSMVPGDVETAWVLDVGFREIDLETGNVVFEWWATRGGAVNISETTYPLQNGRTKRWSWDWFHANSIEKNSAGDYMISARYTNTIYKISGKDGSIMWRLGGKNSSFKQNFSFSRQHDARWMSISEDGQKEIISFLDNSADEQTQNAPSSSARIVEVDTSTWTAKSMQRIPRPDQGLTRMRGNHQILDNGNHFVCWSENAYMSEHSEDGELLMEARFASRRFVTYRGYKFNFTSTPSEPPTAKAIVYGTTEERSTTVVYASWNGATEVKSWRFTDSNTGALLGETTKTGFETTFQIDGYYAVVTVEALDLRGLTIGASGRISVVTPSQWNKQPMHSNDDTKIDHTTDSKHTAPLPSRRPRPSLASHEMLALCLSAITLTMLGVSLWLWRCSDSGRPSIRLQADRPHSMEQGRKTEVI